MTGSADLMASRSTEGLLPSSLATGRPPAWGLNSVSAVGSHHLDSLISQVHWDQGLPLPWHVYKQTACSEVLYAVSVVWTCTVGVTALMQHMSGRTSTSVSRGMLNWALLWSVAFIPYFSCNARLGVRQPENHSTVSACQDVHTQLVCRGGGPARNPCKEPVGKQSAVSGHSRHLPRCHPGTKPGSLCGNCCAFQKDLCFLAAACSLHLLS